MLQALGLLAMHPEYHDLMLKFDLPDTIMSLILPGDELFYTNQTTKYPKYVKHLATRVLVYLGLFAKVSNKVNLFDILESTPESVDLDRPQSFENNFIHHMAIGESSVMNMLKLNVSAVNIEKLIDDILKEIRNDNLEKIQFGFAEKSTDSSLVYNMSYLASVVHPLIIIRLLEHRLFTPFLKKTTNSRNTVSSYHPSVSLSLVGNQNAHQQTRGSTINQSASICIGGGGEGTSNQYSVTADKLTPSTSFPSNSHLLSIENNAKNTSSNTPLGRSSMQCGKSSNAMLDVLSDEFKSGGQLYNHSQISLFFKKSNNNNNNKNYNDSIDNENFIITGPVSASSDRSPMHFSLLNSHNSQTSNVSTSSSSKKTLFKDLSKKLLKSVSHHSHSQHQQQQQQLPPNQTKNTKSKSKVSQYSNELDKDYRK